MRSTTLGWKIKSEFVAKKSFDEGYQSYENLKGHVVKIKLATLQMQDHLEMTWTVPLK